MSQEKFIKIVSEKNPDNFTKNNAWQVDGGVLSEIPTVVRWLLLLFAVLLIILGIFRGEVAAVFRKAATICLECIGIG